MSVIGQAIESLRQVYDRQIEAAKAFRAIATGESSGLVTIRRLGATTADTEAYARIPGYQLSANDEVLCVNVNGKPVIVGEIQRSSPSAYAMVVPLTITKTASPAFLVETDGGTDCFRVNTTDNDVEFYGGALLEGYSDAGTTQKWSIDSSTGNAQFDGTLQADGAATLVNVNTPVFGIATTGSTLQDHSSTSTYEDTASVDITLGSGTWSIQAHCSGRFDTDGPDCDYIIDIGGTEGGLLTYTAYDGTPLQTVYTRTGVSGGGSVTCKCKYQPATAGTIYTADNVISVVAWRTA